MPASHFRNSAQGNPSFSRAGVQLAGRQLGSVRGMALSPSGRGEPFVEELPAEDWVP